MTAPADTNDTSPALVELAVIIRSRFTKNEQSDLPLDKVIVKAEEVAKIYHRNREPITPSELDILYEVLREFGIIAAHIPSDFHVHVGNVMALLKKGDRTLSKSHVSGVIFSRM
jgi:hypothetical protein